MVDRIVPATHRRQTLAGAERGARRRATWPRWPPSRTGSGSSRTTSPAAGRPGSWPARCSPTTPARGSGSSCARSTACTRRWPTSARWPARETIAEALDDARAARRRCAGSIAEDVAPSFTPPAGRVRRRVRRVGAGPVRQPGDRPPHRCRSRWTARRSCRSGCCTPSLDRRAAGARAALGGAGGRGLDAVRAAGRRRRPAAAARRPAGRPDPGGAGAGAPTPGRRRSTRCSACDAVFPAELAADDEVARRWSSTG